ncbi:MAG: hypothetical protein Kapaf2KO_23520 [Candidatus Kapaibacteriales bacterium]
MKPVIRNIISVPLGWLAGSAANMGLIFFGHSMYPIEGVDPNDMEALAEIMPTLSYEYMIFPFLAHALGTLIGTFIAMKIAARNKKTIALLLGMIFLILGVVASFMIPAPGWFVALDLIVAYIPMAYIGWKLGNN